jgi:hypothetical protein
LAIYIHEDGNIDVSPLEFPLATHVSPGIIQLATALEANYDNPIDYAEGAIPVSVSPTLIKEMIDAGIASSGIGVPNATTEVAGKVRLATEEETDYNNPSNGEDHIAVMQPVATKDMIDTAAEYETEYSPEVSNIKEALNDIYTQLNYVPLVITSFTTPTTMYEIGLTPTINCSWSYNKNQDIVWQTLDGISILASARSYAVQGISSNHDIILHASDGTEAVAKSLAITFTNRIYYGSTTIPQEFTSLWVKQLGSSELNTTYKGTYHFDTGNSNYAFIAIPSSYNPPSVCYINTWMTDLVLCDEINFVSDYNITSSYKIFRTTNPGLGSFDMEMR